MGTPFSSPSASVNFSKHVATIVATPIDSLVNALQPKSQHSEGRRVRTACVQLMCVPTLIAFLFSSQTRNKDHNEQLSPCLHHLTQFCMNVKREFIG